jgi:hypothetical protein
LFRIVDRLEGSGFDAKLFDEEFDRLYSDLSRTEFEMKTIAPFLGFKNLEQSPLVLDNDLEIDRFSDSEIAKCLEADLFPRPLVVWGTAWLGEVFGVRIRLSLPKYVARPNESRGTPWDAINKVNAVRERIDELLHALKIFKRGKLTIAGTVSFTDQWPLDGGMNYSSRAKRIVPPEYELNGDEIEDFRNFRKALETIKNKKFLEIAVRRFGFAGDRENVEDRLVDLIIAMESLFLSDAGDSKYRGEMRYRLSERFAFFLEKAPNYSRRQLFDFALQAYDVRSAIVHGDTPEMRLPQEGVVSMDVFVDRVEELLRLAMSKAILSPTSSGNSLVDWKKLIVGD